MATPVLSSSTLTPESDTSRTRPKSGSSDSQTTRAVYSLLLNRVRPFLTARRGRWFYQNLTLTPPLIESAVAGELPLGLVTTSGTGEARWTCLDADDEASSLQLALLAKQLQEYGSYSLYEPSRRGSHLFIFHRPVAWQTAHAYGQQLLQQAGIEGTEVYPKSGELNAVRMPGTRHPKDGKIYLPTDPVTGEEFPLAAALSQITPVTLPEIQVEQTAAVTHKGDQDFDWLVDAFSALTPVTVYGPNRAKALCLWHPDHNPSLLIKGSRFHCQRPDCVWGDKTDFLRWIERGILPPHH